MNQNSRKRGASTFEDKQFGVIQTILMLPSRIRGSWGDCLGNPHANALPPCQLLHISNLASAVFRSVKFINFNEQVLIWFDTLCCPVKPEEVRKLALAQMKRTFQQTNHFLMIDASLQIYNRQSMTAVEACARIFTSGWMRRLWTLQEGSLAKRIWFQFRDCAVDLQLLWSALCQILTTKSGAKDSHSTF